MKSFDSEITMLVERNTKTLRLLALEKVRSAILALQFQPGERLVERKLCERLGVSRSVVREVLRSLESEGLVAIIPGQGPAVAKPESAQIHQIYELRSILESMAARHCAEQIEPKGIDNLGEALKHIREGYTTCNPILVLHGTSEFYKVMFLAAMRPVAWDVVKGLNGRITHLRAMTIATRGRDKTGVAEMKRIYDAITARNADEAEAASVDHLRIALHLALEQFDDEVS